MHISLQFFAQFCKTPLKHRADGRCVHVQHIGVPTVVDAATLAADLLEEAGVREFDEEKLKYSQNNLMVTPGDIDAQVRDLAKVIGYGINWALQDLEIEEMNALLS